MVNDLKEFIDSNIDQKDSLLLRYFKGLGFGELTREDVCAVSLQEGARICKLFDYKGVSIYLADESTLMTGGTFKALEACLTIALCKKRGYNKICFSSGANYGLAVTLYAQKAGIETFFFHPQNTLWKIDGKFFENVRSHLISVEKPEKEVKMAAMLFSEMFGIKHIPEKEWRFLATGIRAIFVLEHSMNNHIKFDWCSQAVCAGYGPIGCYKKFSELEKKRLVASDLIPKFLGVQQESLSPMVNAWRRHHNFIEAQDVAAPSGELLVPALYNTNPDVSYPILFDFLMQYGGELSTINKKEFEQFASVLDTQLQKIGININTKNINGKQMIIEKAGLLGLAGTLKAVDQGVIRQGENVLAFLTGGAGDYSGKEAIPEFVIHSNDDLEGRLQKYIESISMAI